MTTGLPSAANSRARSGITRKPISSTAGAVHLGMAPQPGRQHGGEQLRHHDPGGHQQVGTAQMDGGQDDQNSDGTRSGISLKARVTDPAAVGSRRHFRVGTTPRWRRRSAARGRGRPAASASRLGAMTRWMTAAWLRAGARWPDRRCGCVDGDQAGQGAQRRQPVDCLVRQQAPTIPMMAAATRADGGIAHVAAESFAQLLLARQRQRQRGDGGVSTRRAACSNCAV